MNATIKSSNLAVVQSGGYSTEITAPWYTGENLVSDSDSPTTGAQADAVLLSADYPGVSASIQGAYNDYYAFVGFSPDKTEAVLAYMSSFNLTRYVILSRFGDVRPSVFNMTVSGSGDSKATVTLWGVRCTLYRQEGYPNYSRGEISNGLSRILGSGVRSCEFYRITSGPVNLLPGPLSLIGAATITAVMLIYTSGTLSTRTFRQADVFRLVSDGVFGLWSDAEDC
ncbi:hypothetical protein DL768_000216 [Monosporascus sp. mg162]|nr:hypothetical protein DL768_000216 [Monosporascus sp. mg162]